MSDEGGSLDYLDDAVEDLDASGREYLVIVTHGKEFVVNGSLSKERTKQLLEFIHEGILEEILTEIAEDP